MSLLKRSTSKRDKARKVVSQKTKSAKKSARRWGLKQAVQKVVPKRALLVVGGLLAGIGAVVFKKRGSSGGAAAPPPPPAPAPPPPPPPPPPTEAPEAPDSAE